MSTFHAHVAVAVPLAGHGHVVLQGSQAKVVVLWENGAQQIHGVCTELDRVSAGVERVGVGACKHPEAKAYSIRAWSGFVQASSIVFLSPLFSFFYVPLNVFEKEKKHVSVC